MSGGTTRDCCLPVGKKEEGRIHLLNCSDRYLSLFRGREDRRMATDVWRNNTRLLPACLWGRRKKEETTYLIYITERTGGSHGDCIEEPMQAKKHRQMWKGGETIDGAGKQAGVVQNTLRPHDNNVRISVQRL